MLSKRLMRLALFPLSLFSAVACTTPATYKGPVSPHFDGSEFHNQVEQEEHGFGDFLSWMWNREPGPWHEITDAEYGPRPPARGNSLRATFVNHATVLVQTRELNILTDPIWSERASPVSWAGPKRVRPPGIRFEDLPKVDVVIISHCHYDHMDLATLKRLYERDHPLFLVGLGNASILEGEGIEGVKELDWWQGVKVGDATTITGVPAQHFSMRWIGDRNERLWLGYVIETAEGKVYFAGDTGMGPQFEQIYERFGPMRLSMLPIGAYLPRWFMASVHLNPHDAVLAHRQLHSQTTMGIHFGTFRLADDGQFDAIHDLESARVEEHLGADEFWVLGFGEGRQVP